MKSVSSGSGPGTQTDDGCSVDLYRRLPYLGELEDISGVLKGPSAALELGCGTGKLAKRLIELGFIVTGVDDSTEILACLPDEVEGICSSIESLNLTRRWPIILLASHLINHPNSDIRKSIVEAAYRHLSSQGSFYIQRHAPKWLASVVPGKLGEFNDVAIYAEDVSREWPLVTMTIRYEAYGGVWRQHFTAEALSDDHIESLLYEVGFHNVRWHGVQRLWAEATHRTA